MTDIRRAMGWVVGNIRRERRVETVCPCCGDRRMVWTPNIDNVLRCPICNDRVQRVGSVS
jgi:hypothetical protein